MDDIEISVEQLTPEKSVKQERGPDSDLDMTLTPLSSKISEDLFETEAVQTMVQDGKVYRYMNGAKYQGTWSNGERQGEGEMRWSSTTFYRGHWNHGKPSDHGFMQLQPGTTFEGPWLRHQFQPSTSRLILPESFDRWVKAVNDGYGIPHTVWLWFELNRKSLLPLKTYSLMPNPEIEQLLKDMNESLSEYLAIMDQCIDSANPGQFLISTNGIQEYRGCHDNNKPDGIGRLVMGPKCKYEGEWVRGERHGFGRYFWPNGKVVYGFWKEGKTHGPCISEDPVLGSHFAFMELGRPMISN